jgi:hypothetical protein
MARERGRGWRMMEMTARICGQTTAWRRRVA